MINLINLGHLSWALWFYQLSIYLFDQLWLTLYCGEGARGTGCPEPVCLGAYFCGINRPLMSPLPLPRPVLQYGLPWGGRWGLGLSGETPPQEVMGPEPSHKGLSGCLPGEGEEVVPGKGNSVGTQMRWRRRTMRNIKCEVGDMSEHRGVCTCVCVWWVGRRGMSRFDRNSKLRTVRTLGSFKWWSGQIPEPGRQHGFISLGPVRFSWQPAWPKPSTPQTQARAGERRELQQD